MAVITPQTDVYLLKVPLEMDEINQLTFSNTSAQYNYFNSLPKLSVDNFTYQRKDNTIRYGATFDDLVGYNYVIYRNDAYSDKWFYAFITGLEYVNDNVTLISIKTDVWQTWQFDLSYKPVFVEREHVNDDTPGIHTVPENLELGEYEIVDLRNSPMWETNSPSTDYYIVFCVTKLCGDSSSYYMTKAVNGRVYGDVGCIGGVYSSLIFFAVSSFNDANTVIAAYNADNNTTSDAIVNMYMCPSCAINTTISVANRTTITDHDFTQYIYLYPLYNYYESGVFQLQQPNVLAGNYHPVNNKLLSYPFSYFYVTNKCGEDVTYRYEDFPIQTIDENTARTINYKKAIVPSASLSAKLYFTNYKNYEETSAYGTKMYNYGVNYGKVPVCAWTTDYYTNWLTQNGVNVAVNAIGGLASSTIGLAGSLLSGNLIGAGANAVGIGTTIGNTIGEIHRAETTPPQAHGDINTGDFNFAFNRNSMYSGTFNQHYNSAKDLINMFGENEEKVKAKVFKLLRVKYALSITNETPLEIKKIEY